MAKLKKEIEKQAEFEKILTNANFRVSKQIVIPGVFGQNQNLLIDDVSKRFAITKSDGCHFYNYADLLAYEHNEDGEVITSGRSIQTAVGAATFGTAGALVGSSGKRKQGTKCTKMVVRLLINDLHTPQIDIPCLSIPSKKNSINYNNAKALAEQITATLNYITNSAKTSSSNSVSDESSDNNQNVENNVPPTKSTNNQPNYVRFQTQTKQPSAGKGCLILLIAIILIGVLATMCSSPSTKSNTTNVEVSAEDLKAFDSKTWSDFKNVCDAHTKFIDAMIAFGSGSIDEVSFYNYCKDLESYFSSATVALTYGDNDEQKKYVGVIQTMAIYDQMSIKSTLKYLDSGKTSDLSDAEASIQTATSCITTYAQNRAVLLKQAGLTDEQIKTVLDGMAAEIEK